MLNGNTPCRGRRGDTVHAACVLEVLAPKAGNVHSAAPFDDLTWVDFVVSAEAVSRVLERAPQRGVGRTLLDAVTATRAVVGSNTNLGMLLLLVPLCAVRDGDDLARGVEGVLQGMTAQDASDAYAAIRRARPGGLGRVDEADVSSVPSTSLMAAMALAADHDTVARQYVTGFARVLEDLAPRLEALGSPLDQAIVTLHLEQMAAEADSLIARKCGTAVAQEAQRRAKAVLDAGWPDAAAAQRAMAMLDAWLRQDGHRRNPGTSADLVVAALYAALWTGRFPCPTDWSEALPTAEKEASASLKSI